MYMPSFSANLVLFLVILLAAGLSVLKTVPVPVSFDADDNGGSICASVDGTLYFRFGLNRWKLSSGYPLWHSDPALPNKEHFILPPKVGSLYESDKDVGYKKNIIVAADKLYKLFDAYITQLTERSVGTLIAITEFVYFVDADNGKLLAQHSIPRTESDILGIEEKLISSNWKTTKNIITIVRRNYIVTVSSRDLVTLGRYSISSFDAYSHDYQMEIPVRYIRR